MAFFDDFPHDEFDVDLEVWHEHTPEPHELTIGGSVADPYLVGRNADVAVVVDRIIAYPDRLSFVVRGMIGRPRPLAEVDDDPLTQEWLTDLQIGLAVGRWKYFLGTYPEDENPAFDVDENAESSETVVETAVSLSPLPTKDVTIACRWPLFGLEENTVTIPATVIAEALGRVTHLWPEATQA